mmetsp:Transcript_17759/g.45920  ORF Transcript_17759/g.45920 Transcript_17759/m.45920 type:complete len:311 (-) Transcript_17759:4-936(-)
MVDRVLKALQPAHLRVDRLGRLLVAERQVLELLSARLGVGHVVGVRCVEVLLDSLDHALERVAQHVVVLSVAVLDLLALSVGLLPRVFLRLVVLALHQRHDLEQLLLVRRVRADNLSALISKLRRQLGEILLELELELLGTLRMQLEQPIHSLQMRAQRHLILLLGLLEIAVEHLDDCILAIDLALVILRDDLDLLAQVLDLHQTHELAPLVHDLQPVHARVFLLLRLSLLELPLAPLLRLPLPLLLEQPLHLLLHAAFLISELPFLSARFLLARALELLTDLRHRGAAAARRAHGSSRSVLWPQQQWRP